MTSTLWALVVGAAATLAAGAIVYNTGRAAGRADAQLECQDRSAAIAEAASAARAGAAEAIAAAASKIQVKHTTIRQEVQREIVEVPVYRECRHAPGIVQRINAAAGHPAASGSGGPPAAGAGVPQAPASAR